MSLIPNVRVQCGKNASTLLLLRITVPAIKLLEFVIQQNLSDVCWLIAALIVISAISSYGLYAKLPAVGLTQSVAESSVTAA